MLTFTEATEDGGSLVVTDQQTGTTWSVSGHALDGTLAGSTLTAAPHWNQLFWFSWATFKQGTRINEG